MSKKLIIMVCIAAMIMTNIPNWDAGADVSGTAWSEAGDTVIGNACKDYTAHIPILITNNSDFETQAASEEWEGDGTPTNPYIIENYDINASSANGIDIRNTTAYFIIKNCDMHNGKNFHHGILFFNITHGAIYNVSSYNNLRGICIGESSNNNIMSCVCYNNSWDGIAFLSSSLNNTVTNCTVHNNGGNGITLWTYSNNTTITNCTTYNNSYGIWLGYSSNNIITTNQIYNHSLDGIYMEYSSNNIISNSTISSNNDKGIYLKDSSNNTISNCTISSNNNTGILIEDSSDNEITECNISDSDKGIYLKDSSNDNISGNTVLRCMVGISCNNSSPIITGNNIAPTANAVPVEYWYATGIECVSSTPTIVNNTISGHYVGIELKESIATVSNTSIVTPNAGYGISEDISCYNSILYITNSTLSQEWRNFVLGNSSVIESLNTKFTNVHFADTNSTLNVSWYLNVNVTWKNNIPAEYANVTIIDNLTNEVFIPNNGSTDKNGWIKYIVIQEYTQHNQTNKTYFTPHNVTVSQEFISVWENVTVNETKTIGLILDHNAPEINYTTISPPQEYTIDENTTVEFSFNVLHSNDLILNCSWYVNNEIKNYTILKNTSTIQKINWTYYFNYTSNGNYTVKVEISDNNATVSYTWLLTVNDVNRKPEIEYYYPPKNIILGNHSRVIFNITAFDPDDPDNDDDMTYQWKVTRGGLLIEVDNQTYIFYAEYNASENATNTYLIELVITDNGTPPKSVNHTWTVTVVDLDALYADLLNQTELLEELTELIEKISYVCNLTHLNQSNLDELNITLHGFYEKYNVLLNQTGLLGNIKGLMEQIEDLTEQFNESENNAANLSSLLDELNITLDQLNVNLTAKWYELNTTIGDKEDAENKTKEMENRMNDAIEAKNKAEYKLGASVVSAVIGGVIAGFFVSFLLRRKLPKKGKT